MIFDKSHFSLHKTLAINPEFMWLQFLMLRAVENMPQTEFKTWISASSQLHHSVFFGSKNANVSFSILISATFGAEQFLLSCPVHSRKFKYSKPLLSDRSTIPAVTTQKYLRFCKYHRGQNHPTSSRTTFFFFWDVLRGSTGILVPQPRDRNLQPLLWKHRVVTIAPLG